MVDHQLRYKAVRMPIVRLLPLAGAIMAIASISATATAQDASAEARKFVADHEKNVQPLEIEIGRAWWNANISGKDADFAAKEEAENRLNEALANRQQFARLKQIH